MVNLFEVQVEPGYSSDPSMLRFDYTAKFSDNRTIDIQLLWEHPPYVSAEQPEEVLLIKFNGPVFDREDGLEGD